MQPPHLAAKATGGAASSSVTGSLWRPVPVLTNRLRSWLRTVEGGDAPAPGDVLRGQALGEAEQDAQLGRRQAVGPADDLGGVRGGGPALDEQGCAARSPRPASSAPRQPRRDRVATVAAAESDIVRPASTRAWNAAAPARSQGRMVPSR